MIRVEAAISKCIVFGITGSWLEPSIYSTRGEHVNDYTSDAVE